LSSQISSAIYAFLQGENTVHPPNKLTLNNDSVGFFFLCFSCFWLSEEKTLSIVLNEQGEGGMGLRGEGEVQRERRQRQGGVVDVLLDSNKSSFSENFITVSLGICACNFGGV